MLHLAITLLSAIGAASYQPNNAIIANIERGEAVVAELESLLSQSSIPAAKKRDFQTAMAKKSTNNNVGISDVLICSPLTSKICCKVIVPPRSERRQRYVFDNSDWYCRHCYRSGARGRSPIRCSNHNIQKRAVDSRHLPPFKHCEKLITYYVSVPRPCPDEHTSCCVGEIWLYTGCIEISELQRWLEYLSGGGMGYPPCLNPPTTTPKTTSTRRPTPFTRPTLFPCSRRGRDVSVHQRARLPARLDYCP